MTRWKASGLHLLLSIALAIVACLVLLLIWYPGPLLAATGAGRLVVLLVASQVVVGPLLTLFVFRAGKWGMKFDLVVIALVQLAALVYGMHVVLAARPVFIVFAVDRFAVVGANALETADLARANDPRFRHAPWTGPRLVAAPLPADVDERNALMFSAAEGKDIERMPRYYRDYDPAAAAARRRPLDALAAKDRASVDAFVAKHGGDAAALGYLPLVARKRDMAVVVDADGRMLGYLAIDPW